MNARGGTLLVGVDDSGTAVGLERGFGSVGGHDRGGFENWLAAVGPATSTAAPGSVSSRWPDFGKVRRPAWGRSMAEAAKLCRPICIPTFNGLKPGEEQ